MEAGEVWLGKFQVRRRLGRGGMGTVYEGYDPALDRRVAIKTLTTDAIADHETRGRFEREARAAAKLQHPNIVTIYELGNFGGKGKPYIVMEYLEGTDLAALIEEQGPLPLAEALEIAAQLCGALDFAHQQGVVHRDVKPSNIRCLDDGRVKIMDFGIARIEGSPQITRSGVMMGTIPYMSPEQVKGEGIDGRSDVFSAGCILYEMLAGKRPFRGENLTSILYKIVTEAPAPVVRENPDLPQEIQEILDHALAKEVGDRFQSAGQMAAEIGKLLSIYRKSLPRPTAEFVGRLDEIDRLAREKKWADLIPVAQKLAGERPDTGQVHRILRRAYRELRREESERRATEEERTRHLVEISQEFQQLYGTAQQPTVTEGGAEGADLTPGMLKLRTKTATVATESAGAPWLKLAVAAAVIGILGGAAWLVVPRFLGPREVAYTVRVSSEPPGSSIFVNGQDTGVLTRAGQPVDLPVKGFENDSIKIELRLAGHEGAVRELTLSSQPPAPVDLKLRPLPRRFTVTTKPPGATVRVDGTELTGTTPLEVEVSPEQEHELVVSKDQYESVTFRVVPGEEPPRGQIALSPIKQPGTLVVQTTYPVSLLSAAGTELAASTVSPSVRLKVGRYQIKLYAPDVFLNQWVTVDIEEAKTTNLETPSLGKVSVKAEPGNCRLTISGVAAEPPPINGKDIVAGTHSFVFEWPGGARDEQTLEVRAGRHTYVIGRGR